MASHAEGSALHFYITSGGNAGLACVTASAALGYPSTVVAPCTMSADMVNKLRKIGASDVIQHGAGWTEADAYLRDVVMKDISGAVYIPPFDHEEVWKGAASMVPEIEAQLSGLCADQKKADGIVCSVGGGGLFSGIMTGLRALSENQPDPTTKVIAVETIGAESLYKSVQAGELVTLAGITSLATSLGVVRVARKAFDEAKSSNVICTTVTDKQAVGACWNFANDERLLVEPACGATLAVVYAGLLQSLIPDLTKESRVVLVICGGSNISLAMLEAYKAKLGL